MKELLFGFPIPRTGGWVEAGLAGVSLALAIVCTASLFEVRAATTKTKSVLALGAIIGFPLAVFLIWGALALLMPNVSPIAYKVAADVNLLVALMCIITSIVAKVTNRVSTAALMALPIGPTMVVGATALTHLIGPSWYWFLVGLTDTGIVVTTLAVALCATRGTYLLTKRFWRWPLWR